MPPVSSATRALVLQQPPYIVAAVAALNAAATSWNYNGQQHWVCAIGPGQTASAGYVYTPLQSPITAANTLGGGTYAPPAPQWPPLADSIASGLAAIQALADEKVAAAAQVDGPESALRLFARYGDLSQSDALGLLENGDADEYAALSAKVAETLPITAAADALRVYVQSLTDPQTAAEFDAANPPAGLEWPA